MACEYISPGLEDWRRGNTFKYGVGAYKLNVNYFTCGTYFFDGKYNCVKLLANQKVSFYHGSDKLAAANAEYPVGKEFYEPLRSGLASDIQQPKFTDQAQNSPNSVQWMMSKTLKNTDKAWMADKSTAKLYSNADTMICKDKCVFSYELTKDATFILLDDDYNIWTTLHDITVPNHVKDALAEMFTLKRGEAPRYVRTGFATMSFPKLRNSVYHVDRAYADWFCATLENRYAGYAANQQTQIAPGAGVVSETIFHLEFMFCQPIDYLKRNLNDRFDWQYKKPANVKILNDFLHQMDLYKSSNVDFHAGDLLEHSVWSLLFAEYILARDTVYKPTEEWQRRIAALAFIHDIGKMAPDEMVCKYGKCVYFSVVTHPAIGGDYLRGEKRLPILDDQMKVVGYFDVSALLVNLGLDLENVLKYASIVDLHWEFGNFVKKLTPVSSASDVEVAATDYLALVETAADFGSFEYYYALVMVSVADVMASQAFSENELTPDLNKSSKFFSFVKNLPKKYRGGTVARDSATARDRLKTAVLAKAKTKYVKAAAPTPLEAESEALNVASAVEGARGLAPAAEAAAPAAGIMGAIGGFLERFKKKEPAPAPAPEPSRPKFLCRPNMGRGILMSIGNNLGVRMPDYYTSQQMCDAINKKLGH